MAEANEPVSQEAEARKQIDALKAQIAEKDAKIEELTTTVSDMYRVDKARVALKGKVADPDQVATILAPQLRDVEPDKVAEVITSDDFAARLAAFKPAETPSPPSGDSGEGAGAPAAAEPGAAGFGGPSPGSDGTATPVTGGTGKVAVGSAEYRQLLADPQAYQAAQQAGRIVEPAPVPI